LFTLAMTACDQFDRSDGPCGAHQMNAHIKCGPGHVDLSRYAKNDKQQGSTRLSSAELHALETFFYGLNG
jgi:hypothetical protein